MQPVVPFCIAAMGADSVTVVPSYNSNTTDPGEVDVIVFADNSVPDAAYNLRQTANTEWMKQCLVRSYLLQVMVSRKFADYGICRSWADTRLRGATTSREDNELSLSLLRYTYTSYCTTTAYLDVYAYPVYSSSLSCSSSASSSSRAILFRSSTFSSIVAVISFHTFELVVSRYRSSRGNP